MTGKGTGTAAKRRGKVSGTAATAGAAGGAAQQGGTLAISLTDPGMGFLHRVGLAGLWMTLDYLDRRDAAEASRLRTYGKWERDGRSVVIHWTDAQFFEQLLRYAYRFRTEEGLLYFTALGDPLGSRAQAFATHEAMLATFLQHPKSRKAEAGKATSVFNVDETSEPLALRRVSDHAFASVSFNPTAAQDVAGWLYPGGAVRHVGLGQATSLAEMPGPTLALRFAPVGCLFFLVRVRDARGSGRQQVSVVVPEVRDLEDYADLRRYAQGVDLEYVYSAGPADAALRLLTLDAGRARAQQTESRRCRVVTYGTVPWSSQQRTRVSVLDVGQLTSTAIRQFRAISRKLPVRRVLTKAQAAKGDVVASPDQGTPTGRSWLDPPQVPELAAQNLIAGRPWWQGFAQFVAGKDRREHVFRWELEGLREMVKDQETMPEGPELTFVRACHEAWRRRLGQISQRARDQRLDRQALMSREYDKARVDFSRCKTVAEFRRTITDFWARGGRQQELQQHWAAVMPFLVDEVKWALGRDLALLALASYPGGGADVEAAGNASPAPIDTE